MALVDEVVARVREAAPLLEVEAAENDSYGRLGKAAVATLKKIGVLGMVAPREYGGSDFGPVDAMRVLEELSYIDGSTAWVTAATTIMGKLLHLLEPSSAAKLYADGAPHVAGQMAPNGKATKVAGGYRVTGRWGYGSGMEHADYMCSAALVLDDAGKAKLDESGRPTLIGFIVPASQAAAHGNWEVLGLKATGSFDYVLENVFVPDELVMGNFRTAPPKWGGDSLRIGLGGWFTIAQTGWGLGPGRRALDEIAKYARRPSPYGSRLADSEPFKQAYAAQEAKFRSAHAWAYQVWEEIEATMAAGQRVTTRQLTLARIASIHLRDVDVEVATFAFKQGGGAALREGALQKVFRDTVAAGQAIQVSHQMYNYCARDLLGEAEGMVWRVNELVPA